MLMEPVYNLPKIQFVGGETQEFCFHLKTPSGANYKTEAYDVLFSVRRWGDREDEPVFEKNTVVTLNNAGTASVIELKIDSADTIDLDGRYIYQIMIFGDNDLCEIPGQGVLQILKNIHPGVTR